MRPSWGSTTFTTSPDLSRLRAAGISGGSPQPLRPFLSDGPSSMETIVQRAVARGELAAMPPARIVALPADQFRHDLLMTMKAASPQTIREIVDDVFLPLATNFGKAGRRDEPSDEPRATDCIP
jgi:hypothetical protein